MNKINNLKSEERFTRILFGVIMVAAVFVSWGKWAVFILGILFLLSAREGYCVTCELYKKAHKNKGEARC